MKVTTICHLLLFSITVHAAESVKPFIGINHQVVAELPKQDLMTTATCGILITNVQDETPAFRAGLLAGDIVVTIDGFDLTIPPDSVNSKFIELLYSHSPGDDFPLTVLREEITSDLFVDGETALPDSFMSDPEQFIDNLPDNSSITMQTSKRWVTKDVTVILGVRNEFQLPSLPDISTTDLGRLIASNLGGTWKSVVDEVVKTWELQDDYSDLRERLIAIENGDDGTRLPPIAAIHRDPFFLEPYGRSFTDELSDQKKSVSSLFLHSDLTVHLTGNRLTTGDFTLKPLTTGADEAEFLQWFTKHLTPLMDQLTEVYAPLSDDEKQFFIDNRFDLTDALSLGIYLYSDPDKKRLERNKKLLQIGAKVNLDSLFLSAYQIGQFVLNSEKQIFYWMEQHPDVRSLDSPWGKIGFGSSDRDRWDKPDFKFIYDPGGSDFYANGTATTESFDQPISWVVDKSGDDAYQSTSETAQGCGLPGVGILLDQAGDDTYIGLRWAQGVGYLGVGILMDSQGNDSYHGKQLIQGAGLFGMGVLADLSGNDRYNGEKHAQGVGFTHGLGMLVDYSGDDHGYSTGLQPTNYGDPGIFDAWSQGCGMGFRGNSSGGIGVVVDVAGSDEWEAGNFSQGGGYYYGLGIFRSIGNEDDTYIASRYGQGFCAHQAAGLFIEDGGDDYYTTRQSVISGLAWDQCVTVFVDAGGDDYYYGGSGFSLGASAHNSICLFADKAGTDTYEYKPGVARAGGNKYHGGSSFSLFLDIGSQQDVYSNQKFHNDTERAWTEYGVFRDGNGALPEKVGHPEK